jgi:hypothetical protein
VSLMTIPCGNSTTQAPCGGALHSDNIVWKNR